MCMPTIPLFRIEVQKDTIANQMALFSPAMYCALSDCGSSGWIMLSWINGSQGHRTALYFDGNKQVFFDASTVLRRIFQDIDGNIPWDILKRRHMWLPPSHSPVLQVVDSDLTKRNLQSYFASVEASDPCYLAGCCTTVTILVVWLCLRHGCREPQIMVDALRCVMQHMRDQERGSFQQFLFKLRAWQQEMIRTDWSPNDALSWLRIRAAPGQTTCDYILSHDIPMTFCDSPCDDGWMWCRRHRPAGRDPRARVQEFARVSGWSTRNPTGFRGCSGGRASFVCPSVYRNSSRNCVTTRSCWLVTSSNAGRWMAGNARWTRWTFR